jgi:DNA-binding GntR family transcriptional regulator
MTPRNSSGSTATSLDYGAMSARLERDNPVPLFFQVAALIEEAVKDGALPPGAALDNEFELSQQLGISRPTLRRAIGHLVDKGMLIRRRGAGTVVAPRRIKHPSGLRSLYDDLVEQGQTPQTRVFSAAEVPATSEVAEALHVEEGSSVLHVHRLRSSPDGPIALMNNYLPCDILAAVDGVATRLESTGLTRLLRSNGVDLRIATEQIGARCATDHEAALLQLEQPAAVLTFVRVAYDHRGRAVEYGDHVYSGERYTFENSVISR